jgi:hypothetical protein
MTALPQRKLYARAAVEAVPAAMARRMAAEPTSTGQHAGERTLDPVQQNAGETCREGEKLTAKVCLGADEPGEIASETETPGVDGK